MLVDGADVTKVRPEKRNIGLVFQNYALFPSMNVAKNVGYGLDTHKVPQPEIDERVNEALELVKLGGYNSRRVTQLSGGEQQRVALARALDQAEHPPAGRAALRARPQGARRDAV